MGVEVYMEKLESFEWIEADCQSFLFFYSEREMVGGERESSLVWSTTLCDIDLRR